MEVTTERAYKITTDMTHSELEQFVATVESVYAMYAKNHLDTASLTPLLSFKDELILSLHSTGA
jgi:hypothetical protein